MKNRIVTVMAALIVSSAAGHAQTPPADTHAVMANHQQMMAAMQAADKKLNDLVAEMNAARGSDRLDKVIAVINEMTSAHRQMSDMMAMHHRAMEGMSKPELKPAEDHSSHHPAGK